MDTKKGKTIVSNEKESRMVEFKRKLSEQVASYSSQIFAFLFVYLGLAGLQLPLGCALPHLAHAQCEEEAEKRK